MSSVDFLVIGGGIAGVSIAHELAAHGSVLLVEAESTLAVHTTGRSAAIYAPGYGGSAVRALTAASRARFAALATESDTPNLLTAHPTLWIGTDDQSTATVQAQVGLGAAHPITPGQATALCPVLRGSALRTVALDRDTMDIDVMALHQTYLRGLRGRGGQVRTGSPVTAIRRTGTGWAVDAGAQRHTAAVVVDAAGAWADRVAVLAGVPPVGIRPLRRTIAIASGPVPVDPGWPLVLDGAERCYFRPEGRRMLISPADETPSEPTDAKPDELDVALALERVNALTTLRLRTVHTSWAGLRSFVADRSPVVGTWPDHPGFVFFAGQGGYGIQMSPALAALGAAVAASTTPPDDVAGRSEELSPRVL